MILLAGIMLGSGGCGNEIISSATSPAGDKIAQHYIQNCGATVPYATIVDILEVGEQFGNRERRVLALRQVQRDVDIFWEDENTLGIYFDIPATQISQQESEMDGIAITYGVCKREIITEELSPNEGRLALLFVQHCGSRRNHSTNVELQNISASGPGRITLFKAYGNQVQNGVAIHWQANRDADLLIQHNVDPQDIILWRGYPIWGSEIIYAMPEG